ncbi:MAG: hypothetical protein ACR2NX_14835 [Chthoniobacterales bacterium]
MFFRGLVILALILAALPLRAQDAMVDGLPDLRDANGNRIAAQSAWLDLRQQDSAYSRPQNTPAWVESITLSNLPATKNEGARTVFRIRVSRPQIDLQLMLFRLFFDDASKHQPRITIWDESGTQVMQSGSLGNEMNVPTSETVLLPMIGISAIDVEVPGDGATVRGAYLDWMTSRLVAHPLSAEVRDVVAAPFAAAAPLHVPERDTEMFGTVTAGLSPDTIHIGTSVQTGASFQFGIESEPLTALVSFEVTSARVDSPPEIYLNGENQGAVTLTLPDLADPAYRGEAERMIGPMRFRYTGWLRAQKLVPASALRVGTNNLLIVAGPGTSESAVRATQIQLKYPWEKLDYILRPGR